MKKFIFYTIWNLQKVECRLENYEKEGWRLVDVHHMYWFEFKRSKKRQVKFFLLPSINKGDLFTIDFEEHIKGAFGAHEINENKNALIYVFEIVNTYNDRTKLYEKRWYYMNYQFKACLFFVEFLLLPLMAAIFFEPIENTDYGTFIIAIALSLILSAFAIYFLVACIINKMNYKKVFSNSTRKYKVLTYNLGRVLDICEIEDD